VKKGMIQALIFDFDGLILETEGPAYQSWLELYQTFGLDLPFSVWEGWIGTSDPVFDPHPDLERRLGQALDWARIEAPRRAREMSLVEAQPLLPGVLVYLEEAKRLGLKVGLASSSGRNWVVGHLTRRGLLGYFDCLRTREDVQRTKPDPELYLSVLQAFGLQGKQAIALEDSPKGVLAAKRAGLFCVAVPNDLTRGLTFEGVDLRLDSLEEINLERVIQIMVQI
jgi:HAD superfamily hydrolase (TIGR01509 family)